jgi:predicted AAA+ superfamily ATPase
MLVRRHAEATLLQLAREYPVVAVTGPRQSGKTTLVRKAFPDKPYVSLQHLDERQFATDDPRGFLGRYPDGAILDEVQRCPELFSYLQTRLDQAKRKGLFVLTGSQYFNLLSGITQSLAGRVASILRAQPFSGAFVSIPG